VSAKTKIILIYGTSCMLRRNNPIAQHTVPYFILNFVIFYLEQGYTKSIAYLFPRYLYLFSCLVYSFLFLQNKVFVISLFLFWAVHKPRGPSGGRGVGQNTTSNHEGRGGSSRKPRDIFSPFLHFYSLPNKGIVIYCAR